MRASFLIVPMLAAASPAVAQAAPAAPVIDPSAVDKAANGLQAVSRALLDVRIGGVQAALEGRQATAAEKELTVRDLGRRNDPQFERHLDQRIAAAKPAIERSIRALNETLPLVSEDLQRAQQTVERAIANMPDPNYPRR